jgi:hypothetical protein
MAYAHRRDLARTFGRGCQVLVCGLAGTTGLVLVSSTLAGIGFVWMEMGADPWSQVGDLGGVSAVLTWPLIGAVFVGSELMPAFFTSGTAGHMGVIGITACLLVLWVVAQRRSDAFRYTVISRKT